MKMKVLHAYVSYILTLLILLHGSRGKSPNILFLTIDDLRPNIGIYGDNHAVTPNIDQLATGSSIFLNAYSQQSLCAPSRNSFLTSRRPDTLHLYDFGNYWRNFAGNFTTLPQYFKQNNYFTKSVGKIFHPGITSNFTDDYPLSWSVPAWHPSTEIYKNASVCRTKNGSFRNLICPVNVKEQPEQTLPDIQSIEEAVKFITTVKGNDPPFFLAVGLHKPHIPLKFPKEFLDLHTLENPNDFKFLPQYPPNLPSVAWSPWNDIRLRDDIASLSLKYPYEPVPGDWIAKIRQAYFASVSYIDDLIGKLLNSLKAADLHKNTIIVLLGDHGWALGENGEWSKYSNFDATLRVPLIVRIPNVTYKWSNNNFRHENLKIEQPVELVDLFPTLVDIAGLKPVPPCPKNSTKIMLCTEGKSLLPLIQHKLSKKNRFKVALPKYAFSQYPRPGVNATKSPNSDKPKLYQIKFMGYSVRTEKYRYTEWLHWDAQSMKGNWSNVEAVELYDHSIDDNESLNLAALPGLDDVKRELSNLLRRGFKED